MAASPERELGIGTLKKITDSVNHAMAGIVYAFKNERSLKLHFTVAILVLLLSLLLDLNHIDIALIFFAISLVIMAEMFNTSMEAVVNLLILSHHPLAKITKDVAAGGVLIACANALAVAYLVLFQAMQKPILMDVIYKIRLRYSHAIVIGLTITVVLVLIIKLLGGRGTFMRGGLISGHAAVAFGASTAILCITKNALATSLAFLLAFLVAQSRVEARFHKWLEVILGALIGILASLTVFQIFFSLRGHW